MSKFTDLFSKISGTSFAIIDNNEEAAKAAKEKFPDVKVFQADISEDTFIEEEKINEYDLIIYTTSNHELNIVMAAYLESLGVVNSISLVSSSAYGNIARKIGIEVAVPMRDTVIDEIMSHLRGSAVTGIHSVNGDMEIVEITIPSESPVCGKMLKEIAENGKFLILMGHNQTEKSFHILTGNSMLNAGDKIVVITNSKDNEHVLKKFS